MVSTKNNTIYGEKCYVTHSSFEVGALEERKGGGCPLAYRDRIICTSPVPKVFVSPNCKGNYIRVGTKG